MKNADPGTATPPSLAGRATIAAVVSTFTMGGLAGALDGLFYSHHVAGAQDLPLVLASPFVGALIARVVLTDTRHVYVVAVASHALIGLGIGMGTRPWSYWYPAAPNAAWVAAATFAAAFSGTLWRRPLPNAVRRALFVAAIVSLILVIVLVVAAALVRPPHR